MFLLHLAVKKKKKKEKILHSKVLYLHSALDLSDVRLKGSVRYMLQLCSRPPALLLLLGMAALIIALSGLVRTWAAPAQSPFLGRLS